MATTLHVISLCLQAALLVVIAGWFKRAQPKLPIVLVLTGCAILTARDIVAWSGWNPEQASASIFDESLRLCMLATLLLAVVLSRPFVRRAFAPPIPHETFEEVLDREQALKIAVDLNKEGMWLFDPDTQETWVSDRWCEILGYTPEEVRESHTFWIDHLHPEDRESTLAALQEHIDGQTDVYRAVYRMRRKDGRYIWRDDRGRMVPRDDPAAPRRMIGINADVDEEVRSRSAIESANRDLMLIVDALPSMVFFKDAANNILRVNQAVADSLGRPRSEIEGRHSSEFFAEADQYYEDDLRVIASGAPRLNYVETITSDGAETLEIRTDKIPLPDPETGGVTRLLVITTDVTRERRTERELLSSRARFARAVAGTSDGLFEWNLDTGAVWYAPRFQELFGEIPGEMPATQEAFYSRILPEDAPQVAAQVSRAVCSREPMDALFRIAQSDDEGPRWVRLRGQVDQTEAERLFSGSAQDVTTLKRSELELTRRTFELQSVFEAWPDLCFRLSADGVILGYRAGTETNLYARPSTFLGRRMADVLPPDVGARFDETICEATSTREMTTFEYQLTVDSGDKWFEARVVPHSTGEVLCFIRDINDRRAAEEQSSRLLKELRERNEDLDQFAYVASHDLKAPLRGVTNLAIWIEEDAGDVLPSDSRRHLELLKGRIERMENLLEGLLMYSRAGRTRGSIEEIDVATLLHGVRELASAPTGFEIVIGPGQPTLRTNKIPLQQVFLNLVTNAIKHHDRDSGQVEVTVRDLGGHYEWSVSDDGPGIDQKFRDEVFQMFRTLKPRDEVEASGMGLAIVQKTVESQGGQITLESEGRGTTFRFTWPKQPEVIEGDGVRKPHLVPLTDSIKTAERQN